MAMFESEGYCPSRAFGFYQDWNPLWDRTKEILGDRIAYMVYSKTGIAFGREPVSIVDAVMGGTGTLGIEFACIIRELIPYCKLDESGRKILLTDLISPYQVAGIYQDCNDGVWKHYRPEDWSVTRLIQDDRYILFISDDTDEVQVQIFKK